MEGYQDDYQDEEDSYEINAAIRTIERKQSSIITGFCLSFLLFLTWMSIESMFSKSTLQTIGMNVKVIGMKMKVLGIKMKEFGCRIKVWVLVLILLIKKTFLHMSTTLS